MGLQRTDRSPDGIDQQLARPTMGNSIKCLRQPWRTAVTPWFRGSGGVTAPSGRIRLCIHLCKHLMPDAFCRSRYLALRITGSTMCDARWPPWYTRWVATTASSRVTIATLSAPVLRLGR